MTTEATTTPTCAVVRSSGTYQGKQGFEYFSGISAETVGARAICMHLLEIPPGGRAKAHLHENHEPAIYVISGQADAWFGEGLKEHVLLGAGDFFYIPAGVPHLPANNSQIEPCVAILARTDPMEQESVVLRPDLDGVVP